MQCSCICGAALNANQRGDVHGNPGSHAPSTLAVYLSRTFRLLSSLGGDGFIRILKFVLHDPVIVSGSRNRQIAVENYDPEFTMPS
jgi:hypothetical protein